ncbi:M56 family metallopeptidase [Paenibacillus urinalis]|uniref:M56 family metallopeptidase n=1 Tax=Paenibacillus urinalis TaxID=521520 RepID=UPI0019614FB3
MEEGETVMWSYRSLTLFSVGMAITAAIFIQMGLYGLHMIWDVPMTFNLLTWCTHWMKELGLWSLIHLLNVLVLSTFLLMLLYIIKHAVRTMNVNKYIRWLKDDTMSKELASRYKHLHLEQQMIVISAAEPVALAFGMFRRRIVLSTGLIDMLDEQELTAVLYHEYYHLRHYDPLKTFLLTLSVSILGYVPILKNILANYKMVREILADNYAIKQSGSAVGIGGALIKLIRSGRRDHRLFTGAVVSPFAADVSINDRISRILEPDKELLLPYSKWNIAVSFIVMTALFLLFNYAHY